MTALKCSINTIEYNKSKNKIDNYGHKMNCQSILIEAPY